MFSTFWHYYFYLKLLLDLLKIHNTVISGILKNKCLLTYLKKEQTFEILVMAENALWKLNEEKFGTNTALIIDHFCKFSHCYTS